MSDLTDFLLSRIAEDEQLAAEVSLTTGGRSWKVVEDHVTIPSGGKVSDDAGVWCVDGDNSAVDFGGTFLPVADHISRHDPARILAECEAKRRRIFLLGGWDALCPPDDWPEGGMEGAALADSGRFLLRVESFPYSNHPDYREEWKP